MFTSRLINPVQATGLLSLAVNELYFTETSSAAPEEERETACHSTADPR